MSPTLFPRKITFAGRIIYPRSRDAGHPNDDPRRRGMQTLSSLAIAPTNQMLSDPNATTSPRADTGQTTTTTRPNNDQTDAQPFTSPVVYAEITPATPDNDQRLGPEEEMDAIVEELQELGACYSVPRKIVTTPEMKRNKHRPPVCSPIINMIGRKNNLDLEGKSLSCCIPRL